MMVCHLSQTKIRVHVPGRKLTTNMKPIASRKQPQTMSYVLMGSHADLA